MKKWVILLVLVFLISIFSINAQPPFVQQSSSVFGEGYIIKIQEQGLVLLNNPFEFHFHIFNISNGAFINTDSGCYLDLYDPKGRELFKGFDGTADLFDYEFLINKDNFSETGQYSYIVQCNSTTNNLGGFGSIGFTVTETKEVIPIAESLLYVILTPSIFILFLLSLMAAIKIPYSNKKNEKGAVIQVTKLKYVKLLSISLTYIFFVLFLNVLVGLSDKFVSLSLFVGLIGFIFEMLIRLTLPIGIFIIVLAFFEIIKDANIQKQIKKFGEAYR